MQDQISYRDYVTDDLFLKQYNEYQQKHRDNIKESDKVILKIAGELFEGYPACQKISCLDIGCSTGNLLLHLKNAFPQLELTGGDLAVSSIEKCRADKDLEGINFEKMNMLELGYENKFDLIIANAVAVYFDYDEYEKAAQSIYGALKKGGAFIAFEWFHPFEQDLKIIETSRAHPNGLKIYFRPYRKVKEILERSGFAGIEFKHFSIQIDLMNENTYLGSNNGYEDLNSSTIKTDSGERMLFRGALYQPWCHLVARKAL